jgi:enterochelin esterase-like enzyme
MGSITALLDTLEAVDDAAAFSLLDELRRHEGLASVGGADAFRAARILLERGDPDDLGAAGDLAWRAHGDGVDGAGTVFATCADRMALMSGRPQRFGTVLMPHLGDAHLAPLDGGVSDDMRRQLGLADLAGIRAEVDDLNRVQARRRAVTGELPKDLPFARIWRDPTATELRDRWKAEGQPVWADGDELTLVCDRPLAGAIAGPVFEMPLWRVDDLLVLTVKVQRLPEAVFTYGFWPLTPEGGPAFSRRPDPEGRWRGPEAPPVVPTNDEIVGQLIEHAVESGSLGEPRRVAVYRPPGHTRSEKLPVVYATDGQMFAPYARRIDAAIAAGTIPRLVVVAAHSAGFDPARGGNLRAYEYLLGFDPRRFERHERFFIDELAAWAEEELGVSSQRYQKVVFGCSDGGGHAMTAALFHADRFGTVIAYSTGTPPQGHERWGDGEAPYIELCAGLLEPNFFGATQAWTHWLTMQNVRHHWTERVCGHEPLQWVEELPGALGRALA